MENKKLFKYTSKDSVVNLGLQTIASFETFKAACDSHIGIVVKDVIPENEKYSLIIPEKSKLTQSQLLKNYSSYPDITAIFPKRPEFYAIPASSLTNLLKEIKDKKKQASAFIKEFKEKHPAECKKLTTKDANKIGVHFFGDITFQGGYMIDLLEAFDFIKPKNLLISPATEKCLIESDKGFGILMSLSTKCELFNSWEELTLFGHIETEYGALLTDEDKERLKSFNIDFNFTPSETLIAPEGTFLPELQAEYLTLKKKHLNEYITEYVNGEGKNLKESELIEGCPKMIESYYLSVRNRDITIPALKDMIISARSK